MLRKFLCALLFAAPATAFGDEAHIVAFDGSFDDATFAVESAIIGQGLVIDYVSHVGDMLKRTGGDVGSDKVLFTNADIFVFCSAVISREVMEEDPLNIAHCPYGIFVTETPDGVAIGRRDYPAGPMDKVEALLDAIIADAAGS